MTLEDGQVACAESITGFLRAVDGLSEYDLLGSSRCHGWSRLDVVVHVIGGWEEMLRGLVSRVDTAPTVDAASFWPAFADQVATAQLDLLTDEPAPANALRLARATIEALVGEALPPSWSDADATLIGTGRLPVPDGSGPVAARLPALG